MNKIHALVVKLITVMNAMVFKTVNIALLVIT